MGLESKLPEIQIELISVYDRGSTVFQDARNEEYG
jgi:hypothetical protein